MKLLRGVKILPYSDFEFVIKEAETLNKIDFKFTSSWEKTLGTCLRILRIFETINYYQIDFKKKYNIQLKTKTFFKSYSVLIDYDKTTYTFIIQSSNGEWTSYKPVEWRGDQVYFKKLIKLFEDLLYQASIDLPQERFNYLSEKLKLYGIERGIEPKKKVKTKETLDSWADPRKPIILPSFNASNLDNLSSVNVDDENMPEVFVSKAKNLLWYFFYKKNSGIVKITGGTHEFEFVSASGEELIYENIHGLFRFNFLDFGYLMKSVSGFKLVVVSDQELDQLFNLKQEEQGLAHSILHKFSNNETINGVGMSLEQFYYCPKIKIKLLDGGFAYILIPKRFIIYNIDVKRDFFEMEAIYLLDGTERFKKYTLTTNDLRVIKRGLSIVNNNEGYERMLKEINSMKT